MDISLLSSKFSLSPPPEAVVYYFHDLYSPPKFNNFLFKALDEILNGGLLILRDSNPASTGECHNQGKCLLMSCKDYPKGIVVYPVIPVYKPKEYERKLISTGNTELDKMLEGGILKGSKVYIAGKTGVGKTSLCLQILKANDEKGNVGILYAFDESKDEILRKYKEVFDYEPKKLVVREVEDISLGEFYNMVIEDIKLEPEIVAIDPLNAVDEMAISTAEFLSMLSLLKNQLEGLGITFIGIYEITQPISEFHFTGAGMSRFADYLIVGRHMEMEGELLKTIAVIKNRFGNHERTIRILDIESGKGLKIGEPLKEYSGIMSGVIRRATS